MLQRKKKVNNNYYHYQRKKFDLYTTIKCCEFCIITKHALFSGSIRYLK